MNAACVLVPRKFMMATYTFAQMRRELLTAFTILFLVGVAPGLVNFFFWQRVEDGVFTAYVPGPYCTYVEKDKVADFQIPVVPACGSIRSKRDRTTHFYEGIDRFWILIPGRHEVILPNRKLILFATTRYEGNFLLAVTCSLAYIFFVPIWRRWKSKKADPNH